MNHSASDTASHSSLRFAATTLIVRPSGRGLEVLLLERAGKDDRNNGAWVFPGGVLDSADALLHGDCHGLDDVAASARLGLPRSGLDFYVAAIRETFEEAGLLFARDADGHPPSPDVLARLWPLRGAVARRERDLGLLCRSVGLQLAPALLHYVGHRVTPPDVLKRFDTRFFLAIAPQDQEAACDACELVQHAWVTPDEALNGQQERKLLRPTRLMLELLAGFDDVPSLIRWAEAPRVVERVEPQRASQP